MKFGSSLRFSNDQSALAQVCELVDNELLGEGTLTSIADARRRLLTPTARVVPSGGVLWALPVQVD